MIAFALDRFLNPVRVNGAAGAWPAGTRMLATAAGTLRVRDTGGSGPAIVMVPDGPNVIEHHDVVIAQLAPHARVVCFDMPGFGFSAPPPGYSYGLEEGARVVFAVMDALGIREAALHFSCANGFYALAAARLAPQRVRALVLCQVPSLPAMRNWARENVPLALRVPVLGQLLNRAMRVRLSQVWYSLAVPERGMRPAFREPARRALAAGGCFCLASFTQGLAQAADEDFGSVRTPATLLWGDADYSHRHTRAESFLDVLPHARVRRFAPCGHFPDLERPAEYAQISLAAINA